MVFLILNVRSQSKDEGEKTVMAAKENDNIDNL